MKPRYQKKKNAGCPEWILSGVREKYQQAISKGGNNSFTPSQATPGGTAKEAAEHGKEAGRNTSEQG
jgi:hypothetical protein